VGSTPTGRFALISCIACSTLRPRARTSPPVRMAMASPMPSFPLTRNIGCAGSAGPRVTRAMSPNRMIRPFATKLTARMSFSEWNAPEMRTRIFSSPVCTTPWGGDRVLGAECGDQRGAVDPEARELLGRELHIEALVLGPEDVDLRDVRQLKELLSDFIHIVPELAMAEAVGGETVDDAVGVAELVVEAGADDALRHIVADVVDLLAHLVPDVRHLSLGRRILQVDEDR